MNSSKSLSIVIPLYNEEKRLSVTFNSLHEFVAKYSFSDIEIIFVDDGSKDNTKKVAESFNLGSVKTQVISYGVNRGKGYAVMRGMSSSKMDYALMCDADMSTPFAEIEKFIPFMEKNCEIIIGTRKSKEATVSKPQSFIRRNLGKGYTILANIITGQNVSDFTCGFKIFSQKSIRLIFPKVKIERWSYDTELLFLAHKNKLEVFEVPVSWYNDEDTKVRLAKDIYRSFADLIKIRFGNYE